MLLDCFGQSLDNSVSISASVNRGEYPEGTAIRHLAYHHMSDDTHTELLTLINAHNFLTDKDTSSV